MGEQLQVVVNEELTLNAGWWEETDGAARQRVVHPPTPTMFEQILSYLEWVVDSQPDEYEGLDIGREAVAATAVCLRWGSYLAVLLDRSKPLCAGIKDPEKSRISDGEIARINVEASAALAQWIDLMRDDWSRYLALVQASRRLPMPQKRVSRDREYVHLFGLSRPEFAAFLDLPQEGEIYERVSAHPTRTLANALINACWRNGPVEDIHVGCMGTFPLLQRRVTVREEQALMRTTASRLAQGLYGFSTPNIDPDFRPWVERVLPYAFAHELLVTPTGWSLEEKSRQVRLPGWEQNI